MKGMADMASLYRQHKDLPEDAQKKAGKAIAGAMGAEHETFLKMILALLDAGTLDPSNPECLLKKDVYKKLSAEWKTKIDRALPNIARQLALIIDFRLSKETPDSSPHLETMIEQLWQMKQRIEETHDVFVF